MAGRERRRAAQEQLDSSLDALTGLWRRGPGLVVLAQEAARAQRMRQPLTVAFIDVVGLKVVNDSGGHAAGDELLRAVADALRSSVRPYDAVVRYGGDEFICALPGLGVDGAGKRVRNVNETLAARGAAVTIGLAEMRPDDNIEILIARADEELYKQRE